MAIIKTIRNYLDVSMLFEDPQPGSDNLFIQTDAYSKTTLNSLLDKGIIYSTNGSVISSTFGYSGVSQNAAFYTWRLGGILQLNGETTHVRQNAYDYLGTTVVFGVVNRSEHNLDVSPFISMDTNYRVKPSQYFTDGINNMVISSYNFANYNNQTTTAYQGNGTPYIAKINTSPSDLLTSNFVTIKDSGFNQTYAQFGYLSQANAGSQAWPIYRNPSSGNLVWIAHHMYNTTPNGIIGASWKPAFSAGYTTQVGPATNYTANYTNQFLGVSRLDSNSLQFHNSTLYDQASTIYKYLDGSNTVSTLGRSYSNTDLTYGSGLGNTGTYILSVITTSAASTTITGSGVGASSVTGYVVGNLLTVTAVASGAIVVGQTLSGTGILAGTTVTSFTTSTIGFGDRTTNFGGYIPKYASKTFTDTVTTTVTNAVGFYSPLIDIKGAFHPLYYYWDQTRDVVTRYTDINMSYSTGTTFGTYWAPEIASAGSNSVIYGLQRVWYNETFLGNDGRRYLTFMQLHGAGGVMDANPLQRTFVTYQISTSSYRSLSYHSSFIVPSTPKNICWLNDGRTLLAVIAFNSTYIYNFNTSTGWVNTVTFPYQYTAIGRDNLGRVWAADTGPTNWGRLHLLSGVPASVSVVSTASSYNYAGIAIPTSFLVDAFDLTGSRMTATVVLSVAGTSLKLTTSSGSTNYFSSLTVVTSTSTSTIAYGTVVSNGYSSITTTYTI